jgi:Ca2+-transporting ATPase
MRTRDAPTSSARPESAHWHFIPLPDVFDRLEASPEGLSAAEASARLELHGPNRLAARKPVPVWTIFTAQFRSVVVLLLVVAATVALVIGDQAEAIAITAVLMVNAFIGFAVELRARRVMEALLAHNVPEATVLRDGAHSRIAADQLVPGDVIELGEGDAVPADARLFEAAELRASEAALTGESTPVKKRVDPLPDRDTPLADRTSMLYAGTAVVAGSAHALVVGTGMDTELGRVERLLAHIEKEKTPLERRLDQMGRRLVWITLAIAGVVVLLGIRQGQSLSVMVQTGLALAIAAVPEGLPAVATIALAVGLYRMARRQAAVRRLGAVEALGSTTVVCTDKTGTLTAGEMTVTRVAAVDFELEVTGASTDQRGSILIDGREPTAADEGLLRPLLLACALSARAWIDDDGQTRGDPTDAALLMLAARGGYHRDELLEQMPEVGEVPFSSERRLSASFHRSGRQRVAFVKGGPGQILDLCPRVAGRDGTTPLNDVVRDRLEHRNEELARAGLRVVAVAWTEDADQRTGVPEDLTFLALVGMMDPPAAGVRDTVAVFRVAGIRTVMITGDQPATAAAVSRTLGIGDQNAITVHGRDLARMGHAELVEAAPRVAIFSRVSPSDKLDIVTAFQERGEIVAMLGDGVNDAAALKKADVSVAMGVRGTDLAKETADLVLRDDRFATIGAAVEEGRIVYDNVRKFVFYLFSCNVAEVAVVMGTSVAGLPLPLLPLQILWLNLVTDTFPALALAMEPGEPDLMRRPPRRPDAVIMSGRFLRSLAFFATLIAAVTLSAFLWGMRAGALDRALTLSFMTLAFAQLFHLGNARSREPVLSFARVVANPYALAAVPLVAGLQILAVEWPPLARILGTVPLTGSDWLVVLGLSLVPAVVGQVIRLFRSASHSHDQRSS